MMTQKTEQKVISFMATKGGYAKAKTLRDEGVHSSQLSALVKAGVLVRLKRGLYALAKGTERSELVDIQKAIPGGVFCLGTALSIHGIGTWEPPEIQLAIRRDYRTSIPQHPPVRLFSFSKARFELGITEKATEAGAIRIYDREKTICDIIRFRNALGMDVAMEALRAYLQEYSRNIPQLLEYSKLLHMEGSIRGYLEALV
jgi:predicted transcriptional regulator of viral defense system